MQPLNCVGLFIGLIMIPQTDFSLPLITYQDFWTAWGRRSYAFSTTRHGGCSVGNYATLNCTSYTGDNPAHVAQNLLTLGCHLPCSPCSFVIPTQTHGIDCRTIEDDFGQLSPSEQKKALQGVDALITALPEVCLCISTADCIPILLYDFHHHAIGVAHAGWRGTVSRIISHTLRQMQHTWGTSGSDVAAVIGPGISLEAFEIGMEVYEVFEQADFCMKQISRWHPDKQKYHIDLPEANRQQLLDFGIPNDHIYMSGICTHTQHRDFFSARRLGICSGRILSGIMLLP